MEYVAMFIWLTLCLLLGGMMHAILRSSFGYRVIRWLAAPGVVVRKFAMAVSAMVTGATVNHANVYQISQRDVGFSANGVASASKFLVPVAPIFACAVVLQGVNVLLGSPMDLSFPAPEIASLDGGGAQAFVVGLWRVMVGLVRQAMRADWASLNLYVLLALVFSLSLGASVPLAKFRECILGCALLVTGLAVLCALFGVNSAFGPADVITRPSAAAYVVRRSREFLMATAGMALIMMLCGMLASIVAGVAVRIFEMITRSATASRSSDSPSEKREKRQAA